MFGSHGHDDGKYRGEQLARRNGGKHRGKTVFSTDQTIHVWAQRSQPYGRNAKASVYFEGDTLYSYGAHFVMARFVDIEGPEAQTIVLLNSESYSVTTSRHQGNASYAVNQYKRFSVPKPGAEMSYDHEANVKHFVDLAAHHGKDAANARRRASNREASACYAVGALESAREYARLFNVTSVHIPSDSIDWLAYLADLKKEAERERKERAFRQFMKGLKSLRAFRNEGVFNGPCRISSVALLYVDGETIRTSHGAEFPTAHGIKAWKLLKRIRKSGRDWHRNGQQIRLGHFQIDKITADGTIRAGCHTLSWHEVERIAGVLGLS